MKKNYYELLEVDKKVSNEILNKAYKTLVKRYHPDLQSNNEQQMKLINEAYSILSDEYKRNEYDNNLQEETISLEQYQILLNENKILKEELQRLTIQDKSIPNIQNRIYKYTLKQYVRLAIILLCIILGCILLYQIPFIKRFFTNLYNENIVVKSIINVFVDTFTTKF